MADRQIDIDVNIVQTDSFSNARKELLEMQQILSQMSQTNPLSDVETTLTHASVFLDSLQKKASKNEVISNAMYMPIQSVLSSIHSLYGMHFGDKKADVAATLDSTQGDYDTGLISGSISNYIRSQKLFRTNQKTHFDMEKYGPQIMSSIIEPMITSLQTSIENVDMRKLVKEITSNDLYKNSISGLGYHLSQSELRSVTENIIRSYSPIGSSIAQIEKGRILSRVNNRPVTNKPLLMSDILPNESFVRAFNSYSKDSSSVRPVLDRLVKLAPWSTAKQNIDKYLNTTQYMEYLAPLLMRAGILQTDSPYYHPEGTKNRFSKGLHYRVKDTIAAENLNMFAGLLMQQYRTAKMSGAIWQSDPTKIENAEQALNRNGNRVAAYQDAIDFLGSLTFYNRSGNPLNVVPYVDEKFMQQYNLLSNREHSTRLKNQTLQRSRPLEQYYVPKTKIDPETGSLMTRSFNWRKDWRKGVDELADDHWVAVTESGLTHMLGMHGNGSYGYGVTENGSQYTQGRPSMIRVDVRGMFDEDPNTHKVTPTTDIRRKRMYDRLIDPTKSTPYRWNEETGETDDYTVAFIGHDDIVMIPVSQKNSIEKTFKDNHFPSPFELGNYGGLIVPDDKAKTIKQINNVKKLNSSGHYYEDVFGTNYRLLNNPGAFVNMGAFYNMLGIGKDTGLRIDGQAWGDPQIFHYGQQMRFAHGQDKFYLSALDWRPMLRSLSDQVKQGAVKGVDSNTPLFGDNGEVYLPTTDDAEILRQFMTGYRNDEKGKQIKLTQEEIDDLRQRYFVNVMDQSLPYLIDATGMKGIDNFLHMPLEDFSYHFPTVKRKDLEKARRIDSNGMVQLLPEERARMIMEYSQLAAGEGHSGFISMHTDAQMQSRKDVMPESIARAIHAGPELRKQSEELYEQRFRELQTLEGRQKFFKNNASAQKEMKRDPSWIWTSLSANRQIASEIRSLEESRARGDLLLKGSKWSGYAEATPGVLPEAILQALQYVGGVENWQDLSQMPDEWKMFMPDIMDDRKNNGANQIVYAPGIRDEQIDAMTRNPSTMGTISAAIRNGAITYNASKKKYVIDSTYRKRLKELGRDPSDLLSMLTTPSQLYQMNTGDFDGDTITAFLGLPPQAVGEAKKYFEDYYAQLRDIEKSQVGLQKDQPEKQKSGTIVESIRDAIMYHINSRQDMASASAAIRKQEASMVDRETMMKIVAANRAYDKATSEGQNTGAQIDLKGLGVMEKGATHERFLRALKIASNSSDPVQALKDVNIFSTSLPTMFDTHGVLGLALRRTEARNLGSGHFNTDALQKMENWYNTKYGHSDSSVESEAARWYLDLYEQTVLRNRVVGENDLDKGNLIAQKWETSINDREKAYGYSLTTESSLLASFRKRLKELNSGEAMNETNIRDTVEQYRQQANQNNDLLAGAYADVLESLLTPTIDDEARQEVEDAFMKAIKQQQADAAKRIKELQANNPETNEERATLRAGIESRAREIAKTGHVSGSKWAFAWSQLKHWINSDENKDAQLQIPGIEVIDVETGQPIAPGLKTTTGEVDYERYNKLYSGNTKAYNLASIIDSSFSSARSNPMTHIGQLMHTGIESYWKTLGTKQAMTPAQAAYNLFNLMRAPILEGVRTDLGDLKNQAGVTLSSKDGRLIASGVPKSGTLQGIQEHLNALLGVFNEDGTVATAGNFEKFLTNILHPGDRLVGREGVLVGKNNKEYTIAPSNDSGNVYRHVYTDANGNVVRTRTTREQLAPEAQQGEEVRTYATTVKPDMMVLDSNGKIRIVDYKSSGTGADESIPQSAYYASLFEELAKEYHNANASGDTVRAKEYEIFKGFGQYNQQTGEWESNFEKFEGWDPKTGQIHRLDVSAGTLGEELKKSWANKMVNAYQSLYGDLTDTSNNGLFDEVTRLLSPRELLDRAESKRKVDEIFSNRRDYATMSAQEQNALDFYLSQYAENKEHLSQIRSSLYKESNRMADGEMFRHTSRFESRRNELNMLFSDATLQAMSAKYGDNPEIRADIEEIQNKTRQARRQNNELEIKAAITDLNNAEETVNNMLNGVKKSDTDSPLLSALRIIQESSATYKGLKNNSAYFDASKINEPNEGWLVDFNQSAQDKAAEQDRVNQAINARDAFKAAEQKEAEIKAQLYGKDGSAEKFVNREIEDDAYRVSELLGKVNPKEIFAKKQRDEITELEQRVLSYEALIKKATEEKTTAEKNGDTDIANQLGRIIEQYKKSKDRINDYIENGGLENKQRIDADIYGIERSVSFGDKGVRVDTFENKYNDQAESRDQFIYRMRTARRNDILKNIKAADNDEERLFWLRKYSDKKAEKDYLARQGLEYDQNFNALQTNVAQLTLQQTGQNATRAQRIDWAVDNRIATLQKLKSRTPKDSETRNQIEGLLSEESLNQYRQTVARQIQIQDEALARRDEMQAAQSEFNAQQAVYASENFRRMHGSRYTKTMLGRMYDERMNYGQQLRQNEFNYQQRIRGEQDRQATLNAQLETATDQADIDRINNRIKDSQRAVEGYRQALSNTQRDLDRFNNSNQIVGTVFDKIAVSVTRLTQQLGRRMFQRAIQEAKRFVMEFDASMTEIQTITMKSDEQMQDIRSSTIDRAINLRTSVGNVSQVEAALYRQGLSDTEVADRSEAIIKFATVTGSKVQDATKIITTALQNGLVESAEEAMDALTALGDSAATTAVEIGKAMQKCAAAAKVAGVSYGELTSMITVMTSTTQLSGTQVGTALNTLFSRLRQVQSTGYVSDKNGDTTDLSTIETALRLAGIDLRSDQNTFRSPTEIMYDIARNWGDMSDVQRANITTSVAGVRAGNMFSTLMEGMAEDNGETFAKYLGLSEDSEGITESKYEIAAKSLQASINELKSTFDGLVENLVKSGAIKGIVDAITGFVNGLRLITENGGNVVTTIVAITGAVAALTTVIKVLTGDVAGAVVGGTLLLGTIGLGVASGIGNAQAKQKPGMMEQQTLEAYVHDTDDRNNRYQQLIDDTKRLGESYQRLGENMAYADKIQFNNNLAQLTGLFPELGKEIDSTSDKLERWAEIVNGAQDSLNGIVARTDTTRQTLATLQYEATRQSSAEAYEKQWQDAHSIGVTMDNLADLLEQTTGQSAIDQYWNRYVTYSKDKLTPAEEQQLYDNVLQMLNLQNSDEYKRAHNMLNIANVNSVGEDGLPSALVRLASYAIEGENGPEISEDWQDVSSLDVDELLSFLEANINNFPDFSREDVQNMKDTLNLWQNAFEAGNMSFADYNAAREHSRKKWSTEMLSFIESTLTPLNTFNDLQKSIPVGLLQTIKDNQVDASTLSKQFPELYKAFIVNTNMNSDVSWKRSNMRTLADNESMQNVLKVFYDRNAEDLRTRLSGVSTGNQELDHALSNQSLTSGDFITLIQSYNTSLSDDVISLIYDGLIESAGENGWLYQLVESLLTDWSGYVSERVYGLMSNKGLSSAYVSDENLKTALDNSISNMLTNSETYSADAGLESGLSFSQMTKDQRQRYIDYIAAQTEEKIRFATSTEANRLSLLRTDNPEALPFSVDGIPFENLDQALSYIRGDSVPDEAKRNGWHLGYTAADIMYNGKQYYQSPEDIFAGLWTEYVQENPDLSGKRLDLLNVANGATGFQEFMSGISSTLGVTWSRDNMSKVLPKELYSALQATSEGTLDWPIFQQMLQNYQLGQKGYGYDLNQAILTGEGGIGATFMSALQSNDQAGMLAEYQRLSGDAVSFDVFKTALESFDGGSEILAKLGEGALVTAEDWKKLAQSMREAQEAAKSMFGSRGDEVLNYLKNVQGDAVESAKALTDMRNALNNLSYRQYYREQFKAGKRDKTTMDQIAQITGFDTEQIKQYGKDQKITTGIDDALKQSYEADKISVEDYGNQIAALLNSELQGQFDTFAPAITVADGNVNWNDAGLIETIGADAANTIQALNAILEAMHIKGHFEELKDGDGNTTGFDWILDELGSGNQGTRPPRGGGGGGKSHAQQLIESQKHSASVDDHMLKMIQYRRTRYKNAGELTNENTLIKQENEERRRQIKNQRDNISALRDEMAATEQGSDDWYALRDAIQAAEEAIQEHTQAIHDNLEQMKENRKQIRQYKVDIQDMISAELDNREELRRQRLQGTVDMENTILDLIKQRYRDEWDLLKQDIDNKKAALEQEKSLIDERLNARKNAASEASKYEELANLQAQLSRVEMDSSRTREAAELRDKIAKLQDEIAWKIADQEADAQKADLDERIMGYDLYTDQYQEWLDNYLEDNNNFTTELNDVLKKSREDLIEWLKENDKTYADSTKEQQELMVQNWGDMYDEMKGLTDQYWRDYWNQVAAVMTDRESFMDFMMDSEEYRTASNDRKRQLREQWNEAWSLWSTAKLGGAALVSEEHAGEHDGDEIDDEPKYKFKRSWEVIKKNGSVRASGVAEGDAFYTKKYAKLAAKQLAEEQAMDRKHVGDKVKYGKVEKAYAQGGLVDFTGPAWVDGSKTKPEAFLSAEDTAAMRAFLDAFSTIRVPSFSSMISDSMFSDVSGFTVEKLNIEINEAELKEDADYEEVARKVGEEFVRELSKQGLQTANFAFSS